MKSYRFTNVYSQTFKLKKERSQTFLTLTKKFKSYNKFSHYYFVEDLYIYKIEKKKYSKR